MVERLGGKHLAPGVVQIPISTSFEFEELLKFHALSYTKKLALVSDFLK